MAKHREDRLVSTCLVAAGAGGVDAAPVSMIRSGDGRFVANLRYDAVSLRSQFAF